MHVDALGGQKRALDRLGVRDSCELPDVDSGSNPRPLLSLLSSPSPDGFSARQNCKPKK